MYVTPTVLLAESLNKTQKIFAEHARGHAAITI